MTRVRSSRSGGSPSLKRAALKAATAVKADGIPAPMPPMQMTVAEWRAEGTRRFGADMFAWEFVCPSCGHIAKVQDWQAAGAHENTVAFSCIGRWLGADDSKTFRGAGGPCNYAGGGLIGLNPMTVIDEAGTPHRVFAFAEALR